MIFREESLPWYLYLLYLLSLFNFTPLQGNYNTLTPFKYGGTQKRNPPFKKGKHGVDAFEFKYVPFAQRNAS